MLARAWMNVLRVSMQIVLEFVLAVTQVEKNATEAVLHNAQNARPQNSSTTAAVQIRAAHTTGGRPASTIAL